MKLTIEITPQELVDVFVAVREIQEQSSTDVSISDVLVAVERVDDVNRRFLREQLRQGRTLRSVISQLDTVVSTDDDEVEEEGVIYDDGR